MNIHLNNEGQKYKTAPVRVEGTSGRRKVEGVKEGEYGLCTSYTCMKIEH
jgi:hypothetical protein